MKRLLLLPAFVLSLASFPPAASARSSRAEALLQGATKRLERGTIDGRRFAIVDLEEAVRLEPADVALRIALGRAYYDAGFLKYARGQFERALDLDPECGDGHFGLGVLFRREWLKFLERESLDRAIESLSRAARLGPENCERWLELTPLLVEQGDLAAAAAAAARGHEADPQRPDAVLAVAHTAYRLGHVQRADSAFAMAIPGLPREVRERFEDISPVATERDTIVLHRLDPAGQREFVRRFWKENDPDLATPENEAQLEYWSRVTQAFFLYFDPRLHTWDDRGELYVRYGPPRWVDYNPVYGPFGLTYDSRDNWMVWAYPDLGMKIWLRDATLSGIYWLPPVEVSQFSRDQTTEPLPYPDSLAAHGNLVATRGRRGIFPVLPPGVEPRPVRGAIARFQGGLGPRLLTQVESPGGPADSLWAEWVVLDSARTEVLRRGGGLAPSACDATELRVATFDAELPPGSYVVGVSVRDGNGGRGAFRGQAELFLPPPSLALSDVVISCGTPYTGGDASGRPVVRIEPNPTARVSGSDPLTAYFEVYHLSPGQNGRSRFEYVYTVRSTEKDSRIWFKRLLAPRPFIPPISASRQEEHDGPLRRQFVTVPIQSLPEGGYQLEIRVRDLVAGNEAVRTAGFVKSGVPPPLD